MESEVSTDGASREFVVGMKFYFVPSDTRWRTCENVTVTKVGRKWVTLSNGFRFDKTSRWWRRTDGSGYSSPGTIWDSEDRYRESLVVSKILDAIRHQLQFSRMDDMKVTATDAIHAAKLLGVEVGQ